MSESGRARFEIAFAEHAHTIDEVLLAAHGQMHWLARACGTRGCPPFDASLNDAVAHFGMPPNAPLDLWMMCAALDRLSMSWTGKGLEMPGRAASVPGAPVAPIDEPVGPDEAVGKPPNGADDGGQQRLRSATEAL